MAAAAFRMVALVRVGELGSEEAVTAADRSAEDRAQRLSGMLVRGVLDGRLGVREVSHGGMQVDKRRHALEVLPKSLGFVLLEFVVPCGAFTKGLTNRGSYPVVGVPF